MGLASPSRSAIQHSPRVHRRDHRWEVLRRGPDERGPADVDVLQGFLQRHARLQDCLDERVEINGDQIYRIDPVLGELRPVAVEVTPSQDACVHLRMEGLDPAVHKLWEARQFGHLLHRQARVGDGPPVPPVLTSSQPALWSALANSARPVLSCALRMAFMGFLRQPYRFRPTEPPRRRPAPRAQGLSPLRRHRVRRRAPCPDHVNTLYISSRRDVASSPAELKRSRGSPRPWRRTWRRGPPEARAERFRPAPRR